ncbi:hypothetical protein ONZ45_g17400 [Pleurotus djamor]|nr:hypothetical protein ONZ45_g17400 [Pleurotus djamor]
MREEMEAMKEKIRELEGEKKGWEEDAKKAREVEKERNKWVTWKTAALEREASHHRQLSLSYQKTFTARLRADRAESTLHSINTSFDLERAEWEEEKGMSVGDLEKIRRENKGVVYLRARIATAEAGMGFWEKEYRGKNKDSSANCGGEAGSVELKDGMLLVRVERSNRKQKTRAGNQMEFEEVE